MMIQWSDFVSQVASSPYKKDTGFALLPGDPSAPKNNIPHITPGKGYSSLGGWVLAVNSQTKHPNAAVKFALWATGLNMTPSQRLHYENTAFTGFGFVSSYTNPATLGYKLGRFPVELETYRHYVRRRPDVGAGLQVQTIIGDQVNEAFTGEISVQSALQGMTTELFDEMQNKEYIPSSMNYSWPSKYVTHAGTPR
jgi:ABC-type glycerol-3-phosphate transport system substrate-binding protein